MNQTLTANSIALAMLDEFDRELVSTRKFLERIPADKLSWKPHPKSMSVGQLGYHIADTFSLALQIALIDRIDAPNFPTRHEPATHGELLTRLDQGVAYVRKTLPTLDDDRMNAIFTIDLPDGKKFELPRQRFLRSILFNHIYHHRGQLGVYLRLLGVSVPSSYGPSGDEPGGI